MLHNGFYVVPVFLHNHTNIVSSIFKEQGLYYSDIGIYNHINMALVLFHNDARITSSQRSYRLNMMWFWNFLAFGFQGKRRRAEADFPGADVILKQIKEKAKKKRIGLTSKGPPARGIWS